MSNSLALVKQLETRQLKGDVESKLFLTRYRAMHDYLCNKYYKYVQAQCPYFTDHGESHINGVIWASGKLLQNSLDNDELLTSFDIYLLLTSIIWHDAGMVATRQGHEVKVRDLLKDVEALAFNDITEQRIVEEIIGAHTGKGTIQRLRREELFGRYKVYPRILASILRFGDEISEDSSRISPQLLQKKIVPEKNRIFWHYASCVKASQPDLQRERVILTLEIDRKDAVLEFSDPDPSENPPTRLTLIEYAIRRVEKVVSELAYCAPHFTRHASIQTVEVRLSLVDGTQRLDDYDEMLEFAGPDYPDVGVAKSFFAEHPKWNPRTIMQLN